MKNIEDTIFEDYIAVNSFAVCKRMIERLKELDTNSIELHKEDLKLRMILWILISHMFGQMGKINMAELWNDLSRERKKGRKK